MTERNELSLASRIRLIATDLDGTLLDSQKQPPAEFPATVHVLCAAGVRVVIASGRQFSGVLPLFPSLRDDLFFICENGAVAYHGTKLLFRHELAPEQWRALCRLVKSIPGVTPILCGMRYSYFCSPDPAVLAGIKNSSGAWQNSAEYQTQAAQDHILKIAFFTPPERMDALLQCLRETQTACSFAQSGTEWIDLMPPGVNKGTALAELQKQFDITPPETMVFGDYPNDIAMFQRAFHSYAMANAPEEVRNAARFTAPAYWENGVLRTIHTAFPDNFPTAPQIE